MCYNATIATPNLKEQDMAYCEIYDEDGRIVKTSSSLRGILEYSRHTPVKVVKLFHADLALGVEWEDGAATLVQFASASVMRRWAEARRCFKGATFRHYD
jgi:hypothetical protein